MPAPPIDEEATMLDAVLILTVLAFFGVAIAYVHGCQRL
jgi:hypothetical protein